MKTKPLILALLVVTALVVSGGSAMVIGRLGRHGVAVHEAAKRSEWVRVITAGVAKAAVRVLGCRF